MSFVVESGHAPAAHVPISARIERDLLLALAFVLPLFEAPKNILWVALLAVWLVNRWRAHAFGGRWDRWDTLIGAWIASGFVVAAFAGIHGDEWRAAADIARYGSVLWILKRSRYPGSTWSALIAAIVSGTVIALAWSYYGVLSASEYKALNLNSVGHVNQSSNYLAIVCGVALMAVRIRWHESSTRWRAAYCGLLALLVVSLFWMESRATVGAAFIMAFSLLAVYAVRRRRSLGSVALAAICAIGAVLLLSPQVVQKNAKFIEKNYWLNGRDDIWRVGVAAWREFPAFGVGMDNFGRVDIQRLESWSAKRSEAFNKQGYLTGPHGHSLFVNSLAERGLFGLGVLLVVLAAWAVTLVRGLPDANAPPLLWTYWGGAAAAWMITIVAGLLNTTLHHEQALLSVLLLGGWLSLSRRI
ncbi:MAG TPA: O-antigen ligase family protein [Burkholderiales bacterium]|nr:O-antigen ligase family protein [Burkholderiales bacterium]